MITNNLTKIRRFAKTRHKRIRPTLDVGKDVVRAHFRPWLCENMSCKHILAFGCAQTHIEMPAWSQPGERKTRVHFETPIIVHGFPWMNIHLMDTHAWISIDGYPSMDIHAWGGALDPEFDYKPNIGIR